ncbi:MAG: hypothetical protein PVG89_12340 [Gammaproteobacteria bacterium]|jgi:hypothetical protein
MQYKISNRYQAFAVHVVLSIPFVLAVLYLVLQQWQPEPYLTADGGWLILGILLLTFIGVGPLLTLMVYKPGKWGMKIDLVAIALLQFFVFGYGSYVFYSERPVFLVFAANRFTLVSNDDFDKAALPQADWLNNSKPGPVKVFAEIPIDAATKEKILKELMDGKPDVEFRAEFYRSYQKNLDMVLEHSQDIDAIARVSPTNQQKISAFNMKHCSQSSQCAYYPLVGKKRDMVLAIDRNDGSVLGAIDVDPWLRVKRAHIEPSHPVKTVS